MKQLLVIFLFGFLTIETFGQQSIDVGLFGGTGTYFGDMKQINFQKSVNPAYGSFIRYNFNPRYALRFSVINGTIGAEGEYESKLWAFNKNVLELSLQFEFNYLKYIVGDRVTPYSTYILGGIGMQTYKYNIDAIEGSEIMPVIPFGLGFKVNLSKRIGIGIEGGMRKSFSDKLDNLDDPLSYLNINVTPPVQVKYTDLLHNNDWTAYLGIQLVYKLIYGTKEWELRTPRKYMIDWGIWNSNRKE